MGTNYYAEKIDAPSPTIWLTPNSLHIGKNSCGWAFGLNVTYVKSLDEWIVIFNDPTIVIRDEYGRPINPSDMVGIITKRDIRNKRKIDDFCVGSTDTYDMLVGEYS